MFNPSNHRTYGVLTEQQADKLEELERELQRWNWQHDPPTWSVFDYWANRFEDRFFDRGSLYVRIYPEGRDGKRATLALQPCRDNPSTYRVSVMFSTPASHYANGEHWYPKTLKDACSRIAVEYGVYARLI